MRRGLIMAFALIVGRSSGHDPEKEKPAFRKDHAQPKYIWNEPPGRNELKGGVMRPRIAGVGLADLPSQRDRGLLPGSNGKGADGYGGCKVGVGGKACRV